MIVGGDSIKKVIKFIFDVIYGVLKDNVSAYAAQAAFFVTISFIPFIMMLISIVQFLPFSHSELITQIASVFPQAARDFVAAFVAEAYEKSDATMLSVTAISTMWAASIGVYGIGRGINKVYCADETRNYIVVRFASIFYTLFLMALLVSCLTIYVFGHTITEMIQKNFSQVVYVALIIFSMRKVVGLLVLTFIFVLMFRFVPNRKTRFLAQLPGAAISGAGWILFSSIFSYYYENMANYSYLYGSLSVLVFFMLWLFFCIYILLIGAEINKCIEDRIETEKFMK